MSWKGKVLGAITGFAIGGGPIGAILGGVLGHQIDKASTISFGYINLEEKQTVQTAFFTSTFSVMGHLAKADGIVSHEEIDLATKVMDQMRLSSEQRNQAIALFEAGKKSDFPLTQTLRDFQQECADRKHLFLMFLEIQLQAALADGYIHPNEEALLTQICQQFNISHRHYVRIKRKLEAQQRFQAYYKKQQQSQSAYHSKTNLSDAYDVLAVDKNSTDAEIKKSYRTLVSQHHPDKLLAKGLPDTMLTLAKEKTQEITKAYEIIKEARKI
ncbi:MAG: co-chaperone DjlA [Methylococcales bacterium]|nr:co-chaperone DjlA [Methylococcales bacterium]